jgi:Branched-chain amino acid aminotransferase/4-amino-4-deoxychorismate lyase
MYNIYLNHGFHHSSNTFRVIKPKRLRWAGHVARMEEDRSAFKILTGKPTGKRPLGMPRGRWEDYIRLELKELYINTRNWVDSAYDMIGEPF